MAEEIGFCDAQFEVKDVKEFAFDPSDISLPEDTCAQRPMDVFERRVIQIFGSTHQCAEKDPFECPFLECDVQMRFRPIDVRECGDNDGCGDLCP